MNSVEESVSQQLYTPAMMAGLLKISPRNIRRWHRMGLLHSVRITHRIPYFDFEQVQCAKRIAGWVAQGARPASIQRQLKELGIWRTCQRSQLNRFGSRLRWPTIVAKGPRQTRRSAWSAAFGFR